MTMAQGNLGNDRVLFPVTAAIYRNGEEKAAMRGKTENNLFDLIARIYTAVLESRIVAAIRK